MKKRFRIHPVFIPFAVLLVFCGKAFFLLNSLAAVILHELGHALSLKNRGYTLSSMVLMPYGATLFSGGAVDKRDEVFISLAGPAANFLVAVSLSALWWFFPETYAYTDVMAEANLVIGVFNLLPFYPLDMSRIILAAAKNKKRALSGLRAAGIVAGVALAAFWTVSLFYTPNHTVAAISVMLTAGSLTGIKKEDENLIIRRTGLLKDYKNGAEEKTVYIDSSSPLRKLLRMLSEDKIYTFVAVNASGTETARFSENQLITAAAKYGADTTIEKSILAQPQNKIQ